MSQAWETTPDDVIVVAEAHKVTLDDDHAEQLCGTLDHEQIEANVLRYTEWEDQVECALSEIEDHLISQGVVSGEKIYHPA
jgi:hypothetical protein